MNSGAMQPSSDVVTLKNTLLTLPTFPSVSALLHAERRDVGREPTEGLGTALDGPVARDRLVALFPGLEHRAHCHIGCVSPLDERHGGDERLGIVVALAVKVHEALRRDDLAPFDPVRIIGAVRAVH